MVQDTSLPADYVASDDIYFVTTRVEHDVLLIDRFLCLSRRQLVLAVSGCLNDIFKIAGAPSREPSESRVDIDASRVNPTLVLEGNVSVLELNGERCRHRLIANTEEVSTHAER